MFKNKAMKNCTIMDSVTDFIKNIFLSQNKVSQSVLCATADFLPEI